MKIFITGGTGFIGKQVLRQIENGNDSIILLSNLKKKEIPFLKNNKQIEVVMGDLSNFGLWEKRVQKFKPEAVIHMAWEGIPDYGPQMSTKNLKYGLDLINFSAKIGCKIFLSTGSCWEYGGQSGKLSEEMPVKNTNAFTAAKNSIHWLGEEVANENKMRFIWTRLFYVYGPGQKDQSLVPYIIKNIQKGISPEIKNPLAENDFVYVEDVAKAIISLLKKCKKSGTYNIATGRLTSVGNVAKFIYKYYRLNEPEKNNKSRAKSKENVNGFFGDISKIKKETGWKPKISIEDGIIKTINSYTN
jgi:UDP-glucose 4-epimerase